MRKQLAVLAATAVLGVTSAFAANPFSDVTPQDWAYQAVAQLAAQGIVNGYPDATFQGQRNITRYEMAQMVAKALVHQDNVDTEQKAIINRLTKEFSAELNSLGVRIATLKNKVGNFKFTGDARLRYDGTNDGRNSKFTYQGHLKFDTAVNNSTKVTLRLVGSKEFGAKDNPKTEIDRMYVQHNFGKYATVTLGRQDVMVGSGLSYSGVFEGAVAKAGKDKVNGLVAFGYFQEGKYAGLDFSNLKDKVQESVYQLNYKPVGNVGIKAFYTDLHRNNIDNIYGASIDLSLNKKTWVGGEYIKGETKGAEGEAWTAGIGYGNYNISKKGTWTIKTQYYDMKKEAAVIKSALTFTKKDQKGILASVKYAAAKNVGLATTVTIDTKDQNNKSKAETYRADINYQF